MSGNGGVTGTIPSEIGELTSLSFLELSHLSGLSGTLPEELANAVNLYSLTLNGNPGLSGSIPVELCTIQESGCPNSYFEYFGHMNCTLVFDCSEYFCGCDCDCIRNGVGSI